VQLAASWRQAGLVERIWEPAQGSVAQRSDEWLGLWRKPPSPIGLDPTGLDPAG
jgi:hypothetical protein